MAARSLLVGAVLVLIPPGLAVAQVTDQTVYKPGPGVTNPILLRQVEPRYTTEALRAKIQGAVHLEAVILADGTVGDVRVLKSLDTVFGLDEEALKAARQWLFKPGIVDGKPVPTAVVLILEFRIHPDDDFTRGAHREDALGVVAPRLMRRVEAQYTADALRAKIQGTVVVEAVVNPDGTVARARIARSLDRTFGLDAAALAAVGGWLFEPGTGTLDGQAVPVLMRLRVEFRIH